MRFHVFFLFFFIFVFTVVAEEELYYNLNKGTDMDMTNILPSIQLEETSIYSGDMFPSFNEQCIRVALGYGLTYANFDFDRLGIMKNSFALITKDDIDSFQLQNFLLNIGMKHGLPAPLEYFSIGFNFDYRYMALNDLTFGAISPTHVILEDEYGVCDIHTLSLIFFGEIRYPIKTDTGKWFFPYLQAGVGIHWDIASNANLDLHTPNMATQVTLGMEYFLKTNLSLFVEANWVYHDISKITYKPASGCYFPGDLDISSLAFKVGLNFYFDFF